MMFLNGPMLCSYNFSNGSFSFRYMATHLFKFSVGPVFFQHQLMRFHDISKTLVSVRYHSKHLWVVVQFHMPNTIFFSLTSLKSQFFLCNHRYIYVHNVSNGLLCYKYQVVYLLDISKVLVSLDTNANVSATSQIGHTKITQCFWIPGSGFLWRLKWARCCYNVSKTVV